jgi:hypothetical protein
MDEKFGFYRNRPFYIVSELPFNRVMECHGTSNVYLKRWRNNARAQQWFFDDWSKTVKSKQWSHWSLNIQGNGGTTNLQCHTTNSRWW